MQECREKAKDQYMDRSAGMKEKDPA